MYVYAYGSPPLPSTSLLQLLCSVWGCVDNPCWDVRQPVYRSQWPELAHLILWLAFSTLISSHLNHGPAEEGQQLLQTHVRTQCRICGLVRVWIIKLVENVYFCNIFYSVCKHLKHFLKEIVEPKQTSKNKKETKKPPRIVPVKYGCCGRPFY